MVTSQITNFVQVIKACEAAGGAGTKKAIQVALAKADPIAQRLIKEALDPYRVFGVKKFDAPEHYSTEDTTDYEMVFGYLDRLASRDLTGDAARCAVTNMLSQFTAETAEYIVRIIDKDLKAGFSAETFNKIHETNKIPTFEVMLADKCEEPEEFLERLTFPALAEWKYDGQRTICIVRANGVEYRARSGKPMDHLVGTYDEDLMNIRANVGYDFVMDGESFASDFTETINAKKEGNQAAKDALRLRAFFMMPLTDWINQQTIITMRSNRQALIELFNKVQPSRIEISVGREVKDYAEMVAYCNEVIDVHKQEGLIVKNWDAVYQWDRTIDWCKVKRMWDVDARVVAWYPGRKKSRLENTVGGITVEGRDEHGRPFRTNVGSGFSDEQRDHIRDNWHLYEGSTAVITYQEMSKAKGADLYSLRFPVVKQLLRDDKVVPALEI
jgi:DNA ligase-1